MKYNERVLKRCPFCGGCAKFCEDMRFHEKMDSFPKWYVMCIECNIRTPVADKTLVMKMWNERIKMKIFNAMDLHKRTGWRLEDTDEMVEQLSEKNLCIIDKNEATEISDFQKRAEDDGK